MIGDDENSIEWYCDDPDALDVELDDGELACLALTPKEREVIEGLLRSVQALAPRLRICSGPDEISICVRAPKGSIYTWIAVATLEAKRDIWV